MPGPVFLRGNRVDLRVLKESDDFDRCWKWINDPDCWRFLGTITPTSEERERDFFRKSDERRILLAITTKQGVHIGNIGLSDISHQHGTAATGTIIGEQKYWGKGFGTDAKMALLRYAFHELNLRKIMSRVLATNPRSLAYAETCGYRREAVFREQLCKNGEYIDLIQLAVFRPQFERAWTAYQKKLKKK